MQDKPTPGPWQIREPTDADVYDDISIKSGPRTVCRLWQEGRTGSPINAEQWANARLIANAPSMELALELVMNDAASTGTGDYTIERKTLEYVAGVLRHARGLA
jgi:hypothetical protein